MNLNEAAECTKDFIEIGGIYEVNNKWEIVDKFDKEVFRIGKKNQKIVILHEGIVPNDSSIILNIFKEPLGQDLARDWFHGICNQMLGSLVRELIKQVVKTSIATSEDVNENDKLEMVVPYMDKIDNKTEKELNLLGPSHHFATIFYSKPHKIAQLQSDIFEKEFIEQFKNKIRKKTWEVFQGLISAFFDSKDISKDYQYERTITGIPEADARLHVLSQCYERLAGYIRIFTEEDINSDKLLAHVNNLEEYHNACFHFFIPTVKKKTAQQPIQQPNVITASNFAQPQIAPIQPMQTGITASMFNQQLPHMQPMQQQPYNIQQPIIGYQQPMVGVPQQMIVPQQQQFAQPPNMGFSAKMF